MSVSGWLTALTLSLRWWWLWQWSWLTSRWECNSDDDIDKDENDNENTEDNGNFHDMKYDNDGDDKNVDKGGNVNELWWWKWYYDDDDDDIEDDDDDDNGNDKNVDVTPRRCTHPWHRIKHHNIWLLGNWHTYHETDDDDDDEFCFVLQQMKILLATFFGTPCTYLKTVFSAPCQNFFLLKSSLGASLPYKDKKRKVVFAGNSELPNKI